ncbi:tRNA glutamyl-Q(34) synthetase GluQRS [Pseudoalteromonas fenneropenaei]|uniref:Glutamyl-Q tRNA(Asp) synthetase n=1 Tax=Pseudoalteromonas fenneropenaei TaxID=1737459 RepID=A0ABV7CKK0_9GAMM
MTLTSALLGSYRGRFAPSPSGSLHFGSLIAALASYLDAKANHGTWLVRIEDIDTPRVVKGADSDILRTLEAYGLHWDESVIWQSQRHARYQEILNALLNQQQCYACHCTRKQIKAAGGLYAGHCRSLGLTAEHHALRIAQHCPVYQFNDAIQGLVTVNTELAQEDYIVKRSDGLYAYQLVVVVDDHDQQISHIIRGADLLEPTARQLSLFQQLGWQQPLYGHVPLAVAAPGFKLSKQNHAPAIDNRHPQPALCAALAFLGITVPTALQNAPVTELLAYAITHYQRANVPQKLEVVVQQGTAGYQF